MPLHDLSYARFEGSRSTRGSRRLALARSNAALLIKRRAFLLLVGVCWIPTVVRGAMIYFSQRFPQLEMYFTIDAVMWQVFLAQQIVFAPVLLMALYTGAGAVSSDLASGAIVVYLSKPISRFDYIVAKAMPVLGSILVVTLLPALALLAVHVAVSEDLKLFETSPLLPLSVVAFSLWIGCFFTLIVLAISSLSRSGRVSGAGFVAATLGIQIVVSALTRLGVRETPTFLSMIDAAVDSGHVFFGNTSSGDHPYLSLSTMLVWMAVALWLLRSRLNAAEVAS